MSFVIHINSQSIDQSTSGGMATFFPFGATNVAAAGLLMLGY